MLDSVGSAIKESGIVIDTVPLPTVSKNLNKFVLEKSKDGYFTLIVTGLFLNKTAYVRAYATNTKGTAYGNEVKFSTSKGKVFKGEVYLTNQQQVNDFGANHYTTIDGDVSISGPITDLKPLLGLAVINAGLTINYTNISNFSGLDSLQEIGTLFANDVFIEHNNNLINFHGLSKLRMSRGVVQIDDNNSLINLDGLDSYIAASAGSMRIGECKKLQNLDGLKNLRFVGDDLMIMNNPSLTSISDLANVSQVYGSIYVDYNSSLTNLNGLEKIQSLLAGVDITGNAVLRDITGLHNLKDIGTDLDFGGGAITIADNPALTDLSSLGKITIADYVTIKNNGHLKNLNGLNLETIKQLLDIEGNAVLSDLSGLEKVTSVSRIQISGNSSLINLNGLKGLTKVAGNPSFMTITGNNSLVSLSGLENLLEIEGQFRVASNPNLAEFCSLKNLFANGYCQSFITQDNAANPNQQNIISNCP